MMQESRFDGSSKPHSAMKMTIQKLHHQLDSTIKYLTPLLPIANCHMVEFITERHWDRLLPNPLRELLEGWDLNHAVEKFWEIAGNTTNTEDNELKNWISDARNHYISVNNVYCLTVDQLEDRIRDWGGNIKPKIRVKEFMSNKKSYEVQMMSSLVASLHCACASTCCVEAGGGRGHLAVALGLGYKVPCLTVDCDDRTLKAAAERLYAIQKQWHAISESKSSPADEISESFDNNLHRFARAYVTSDTDLCAVVREKFPEHSEDVRLLLTGLHTCGNLGPDSLRIFTSRPSTAAVFNVPCCYHLLSESIDVDMFDVFQRDYGAGGVERAGEGFPMSEHLRGYNLGRNARMLAAQSIDRVIGQRQLPSRSLLYRALLQVIIKKYKPHVTLSLGKLKRLTAKCQNFEQYFKMADTILKLDIFDSLPESSMADVKELERGQWKHIVLFYLLRLCLAQVIESVILLDRLLFLMENGFNKVYLVKLFDPVLSPRCHSIVAVR